LLAGHEELWKEDKAQRPLSLWFWQEIQEMLRQVNKLKIGAFCVDNYLIPESEVVA
jgi:hypothetical protein